MEQSYEAKKQQLVAQLQEALVGANASIGLGKRTSNLFRERDIKDKQRLDVRSFNQLIRVDNEALTAEVEGMTTFEDLVDGTLKHGMVPLVVPELKTITIGGAVSGLAIESSSFRYGLVHESVEEMEVLLSDGRVVVARADNEHKDLFYGLPNSYGTLGYVLKLTIKLRRARPFVHLQHLHYDDPRAYFRQLERISHSGTHEGKSVDFVDGTVFSSDEMYITLGVGVDAAPGVSDYTYKKIYYKSIQNRSQDYLPIRDYIWRWDTDWFWCSKNVYADRPLVRQLLGRRHLGSRTYGKMMRLEQQYKPVERLSRLIGRHKPTEPVIQDIEVPIENAVEFLARFQKEVGILPVWVCPTKATTKTWPYPLYPMDPTKLYVNFGFWDSVPTEEDPAKALYNRKVEDMVEELGGMKSLYSTSHYSRERFERIYNYSAYQKLKKKYDPDGRLKGLYEKSVQGA